MPAAMNRRRPPPRTSSTGNSRPRWNSRRIRPNDASVARSSGCSIRAGPGVAGPSSIPTAMNRGTAGTDRRRPIRAATPAVSMSAPRPIRSACTFPPRWRGRQVGLATSPFEERLPEDRAEFAGLFLSQFQDSGGLGGGGREHIQVPNSVPAHYHRQASVWSSQFDVVAPPDPRELLDTGSVPHDAGSLSSVGPSPEQGTAP